MATGGRDSKETPGGGAMNNLTLLLSAARIAVEVYRQWSAARADGRWEAGEKITAVLPRTGVSITIDRLPEHEYE